MLNRPVVTIFFLHWFINSQVLTFKFIDQYRYSTTCSKSHSKTENKFTTKILYENVDDMKTLRTELFERWQPLNFLLLFAKYYMAITTNHLYPCWQEHKDLLNMAEKLDKFIKSMFIDIELFESRHQFLQMNLVQLLFFRC